MRGRLERLLMARMEIQQSLSWVTETFRKATDSQSVQNKGHCGHAFITQLAPNVRRKVQKWDAGPWTPLSNLVEEVFKVYNNRSRIWWAHPAERFQV